VFYNHSFYPDLKSGRCINGTDYPSWMIETDDFKHMYIFHEAQDCCDFWFGASSGCASNIIQSVYDVNITASTNMTQVLLEKWYPMLDERRCVKDGQTPGWMMSETFRDFYLFNTRDACCGFFGYC
jgi:hypothetical protein